MKRILSVVLAISLCLTAFLGMFSIGISAESTSVYLSDLDYIPDDGQGHGSWAGWSDIKINRTVNGNTPKINNGDGSNAMFFEHAVIAHANAQIEYDIEGMEVYRFTSYIGICYDAGNAYGWPSSTFEVKVDGVSIYKSEEIGLNSPAVLVNVSIPENAKTLTLITDGGSSNSSDHTGWFDAKLDMGQRAVEAQEVALDAPVYGGAVGDSFKLGVVVTPENAETGAIVYSVEDPEIAVVSADGYVYTRAPGATTVTATLPYYGLSATAEIRVWSNGVYAVDDLVWEIMESSSHPFPEVQPGEYALTIPVAYGNTNHDPGNALLQDAPGGDFTITVKVSGGLSANYQTIGAVAYAEYASMVAVTRRYHSYFGGNVFCITTYNGGYVEHPVADLSPEKDAWVKLEKKGDVFTGSFSYDGENWTAIQETITSEAVANAEALKVGVTAMTSSDGYEDIFMQDFTVNGEKIPFCYDTGISPTVTIAKGESAQLVSSLVALDAYDSVTYESYDLDVATVDENGVLTGENYGVTSIYIENGEGESQWIEVRVICDTIGGLAEGWQTVNWESDKPSLDSDAPCVVTIPVLNGDLGNGKAVKNLLLREAPEGDFDIRVKVTGGLAQNFESVGLIAYHDNANSVALERRSHSYFGGNVFCITNFEGSGNEPYVAETDAQADAYLRLVKEGTTFTAYYSYTGEEWTVVNTVTNETVGNSDSLKIGLIARAGNNTGLRNISATYTNFTLDGTVIPFVELDRPVMPEYSVFEAFNGNAPEMPETLNCFMASGYYKEFAVESWDLSGVNLTEDGAYDITITLEGGYLVAGEIYVFTEGFGVIGDLNGDSVLTIGDVTLLLDSIAGADVALECSADFNEDGTITIGDVTALLDMLAGK